MPRIAGIVIESFNTSMAKSARRMVDDDFERMPDERRAEALAGVRRSGPPALTPEQEREVGELVAKLASDIQRTPDELGAEAVEQMRAAFRQAHAERWRSLAGGKSGD